MLAASKKVDHKAVIQLIKPTLAQIDRMYGEASSESHFLAFMLGRAYHFTGADADAKPLLDRVIASPSDDPRWRFRKVWANIFRGKAERANGQFDTALRLFNAAEKVANEKLEYENAPVLDDEMRAEFPYQRGATYQAAGEYEKAIPEYEAQGKALKATHGDGSTKAIWGDENAAWCESRLGRFAAARKRYEAVAKVYSDADKRANRGYLLSRLNVANMYLLEKERAKAEAIFTYTENVLKTNAGKRAKVAAADNPFNSGAGVDYNTALEDAEVCDRLADMYHLAARHRDNVNTRTRAYELTAADPKATPEAIYLRLDLLGRAYFNVEEYKKAQEVQTDALARAEKLFKADPPAHAWRLVRSLSALAACERANGQYRQAEEHFQRAVETTLKHSGADSVAYADALRWYASYLTLAGRTDQAMELTEQAEDIYRRRKASDGKRKADEQFGEALRAINRGETESGLKLFEAAHAATIISDREQAVYQLRNLARVYERLKDDRTAVTFLDREIALSTEVHGADAWQTMDARLHVSEALRRLGEYKRARAEIETAARFFETSDSFNLCKL